MLTLLYLISDVVLQSHARGHVDYAQALRPFLQDALVAIHTRGTDRVRPAAARVLNIWSERGVYPASSLQPLRARLAAIEQEHAEKAAAAAAFVRSSLVPD